MELLLQYKYQASRNGSNPTLGIILLVLIVVSLFWRLMKYSDFNEAKRQFEYNPANPENKQRLLETAKANRNYGRSGLDALTLIEAQNDREKLEQAKTKDIVGELKSLSELHEKGSLTDEEFEQAKKKLLRN